MLPATRSFRSKTGTLNRSEYFLMSWDFYFLQSPAAMKVWWEQWWCHVPSGLVTVTLRRNCCEPFAMLYAVFPSVCHSNATLPSKCRPKITTDQKFEACRKQLRLIGLVASIDPERDVARSCKPVASERKILGVDQLSEKISKRQGRNRPTQRAGKDDRGWCGRKSPLSDTLTTSKHVQNQNPSEPRWWRSWFSGCGPWGGHSCGDDHGWLPPYCYCHCQKRCTVAGLWCEAGKRVTSWLNLIGIFEIPFGESKAAGSCRSCKFWESFDFEARLRWTSCSHPMMWRPRPWTVPTWDLMANICGQRRQKSCRACRKGSLASWHGEYPVQTCSNHDQAFRRSISS